MEGDREHLLAEGRGYSPGTRWHPTGLPAVMSARVCNAGHQIRNLRPEKWSSMVVVRCGNPDPRMSAQGLGRVKTRWNPFERGNLNRCGGGSSLRVFGPFLLPEQLLRGAAIFRTKA